MKGPRVWRSQAWEERLGSCERAATQAFVSMVCLQCLSFPSSARGPGAGAHPHSNPGCGAKGACNSGPASGLSVTRWASLGAAVAIYLLQGARLQSLPLFSFLVVLGCLIVVDNQLSHHQQDRRSEGVVYSRLSSPLSIQSPDATRRSRINTANMPGIRKLVELSVPALLLF